MAGRRIGWIGIAIVVVGALVAAAGIIYYIKARPVAGAEIDRFPIEDKRALIVRAEKSGDRSFVELRDGDTVVWQALVPPYAGAKGRPALAWSPTAVTVRVERDGRAEVFALRMRDGSKLGGFRLAPERQPITTQPTGPITLTDHVRSYEFAGGSDWHEVVAVDLKSGRAIWKTALGPEPIKDGGIRGGILWIMQGNRARELNVFSGVEKPAAEANPL